MPLLNHFRRGRFKDETPSPAEEEFRMSRLDRLVARQKAVRIPSELDLKLEALEEECSAPLYEPSVYISPLGIEEE